MSTLVEMYTYEVMNGATVHAVPTEDADHPAEHAISPLEAVFAWEANEGAAQHVLTADLGEIRECDGFSFMHHETEVITGPGVYLGIDITVEYSDDATLWTSVPIAQTTDADDTPNDTIDLDVQIKLRHFTNAAINALQSYSARYWRFTVEGLAAPNYYAPSDCRISMCWLFNLHQIDRGAAFPSNDTEIYPVDNIALPFGKQYRTGYSVNSFTPFTRTWMLTQSEYDTLREVLRKCNGIYRPFVLVEAENVRRLCKFETDLIEEELLDVGLYRVTCRFVAIPLVKKDKYH